MINLETILDSGFVREQSHKMLAVCENGGTHFQYNPEKLDEVASFVIEVSKQNYPDDNYPYHGRINHINAGGVKRTEGLSAEDLLDLVFISVLVDAGAGPDWKFNENGTEYTRSEGLAVASVALYQSGLVSTQEKLKNLSVKDFSECFQVSESNPLQGISGRVSLLNKLGEKDRPSTLLKKMPKEFEAKELLKVVLKEYHDVWPKRMNFEDTNVADIWEYDFGHGKEYVPFHKLSQWLTYSLVEIFENNDFKVNNLDGMTGLPEYRNGGLFLDLGLLEIRDPKLKKEPYTVDSDFIIEWRALTVALLDILADVIRTRLNKTSSELPLVKILEGGTWAAGRKIAYEKREGKPPLNLQLDGTVF